MRRLPPMPDYCHTQPGSAFTLIELVVVMVVITAMAAMTYGYMDYARQRSLVSGTEAIVHSVATAIVNHQARYWQYSVDGELRNAPMFDVNQDGILDGDPQRINQAYPETYSKAIIDSDYKGFLDTVGMAIPVRHVNDLGQIIDSWQQPLRIDRHPHRYGANRVGVWSDGPDGITDSLDDIRSWQVTHD
ncbi:MAG: prepilin-type N-terminal cleavage/methylation domain-containing protein [Planctomycetota bacterium]|nr:MAG: prepilin-type N-terminal cleavage/methylation domain-containing protein [Planctomycetota bacterium]